MASKKIPLKKPKASAPGVFGDAELINCLTNYRMEADDARRDRIQQNRTNFDAYHLRQDFSYKQKGQSREFLPKMSMAVEQVSNFLQQGLVDTGEWFRCYPAEGLVEDMMKISPKLVYNLTKSQLAKAGFIALLADAAKLGLIGSLMIAKVGGKYVNKPTYKAKTTYKDGKYSKQLIKKMQKVWQLDISLLRQEDYYPDPTNRGLYELQDIYMDYFEIERLATGPDAIYDLKAVQQLQGGYDSSGTDQDFQKTRETGQNMTSKGYRKQIKLTEIWGNILDADGMLQHENVVCTIANDRVVIQKPTPNPYWHGESPFVKTAIITVPHSPWGKAMMDAPTMLNKASNELFNLILDGGLMAVHGIKQVREHWLEDASQLEDGIAAGDTLRVNSSCPPGATALERVDTSTVPQEGLNVLNLVNQEFNASALTNDLRMGVASFRSVKATEVVEASQTITSMFSGMAKKVEGEENDSNGFITPILQKSWKVIAQHLNEMDEKDIAVLVGQGEATKLKALGNEEIFAETVQNCCFQTFGISAVLNKHKDFTKVTALLQTIGASNPLMEAFLKKYDLSKLLDEVMKALDINVYRLQADNDAGGDQSQAPAAGAPQAGTPDAQSQIPQAGAAGNQAAGTPQSEAQPGPPPTAGAPGAQGPQPIPQTKFPGSKATPKGGF